MVDDETNLDTPTVPLSARKGKRSKDAGLPSRYEMQEVLGEGGMGAVYRAHDKVLNRDVAVKMLWKDMPAMDKTIQRERFVREAQAAARLAHPNIVQVHDVDPDGGWIVMELVKGESLRNVAQKGKISPATLLSITEQLLKALEAAHAAGIVHRDVKPSNVMLDGDGHVTLVDFGVARLLDVQLTQTGDTVGTPAYMAPEQLRGAAIDGRTDLYALGLTLYELLTGERIVAFEKLAHAKLAAACGRQYRNLAYVIEKCLQNNPDARFASASAALAALHAPPPKSPRVIAAAIAAFLVVVGVGTPLGLYARKRAIAKEKLAAAMQLAQRGEHETAGDMVEAYRAHYPDDPDALALKFLTDWWRTGEADAAQTLMAKLKPAQRAMVHGISLITQRRETESIAYMMRADREHPGSAEILFALGEAQWHGQEIESGVATLERAFMIDPRWQMALHHVVEFRLNRGEAAKLKPIADKLRGVDPPMADTLECRIAIGERDVDRAIALARAGVAKTDAVPELFICLSQALAIKGDYDDGMAIAKRAFEQWPIDMREWGGFSQYAEFFLYRGQLKEYLALVRDKPSQQRTLVLAMWPKEKGLKPTRPTGPGMRMPPMGAAIFVMVKHGEGHDELSVYDDYPEREVQAYGRGLAAEGRGDLIEAMTQYRRALEVPAKGDMRMLIGHHLARVLYALGDKESAKAACKEVIEPLMYQNYRAVLMPDCLLWSGEPKRLLADWQGTFDHPAVAAARR